MQFSTGHAGIPVASCTAINASTNSLTISGITITAGTIYQVFFTKYVLDLPVEVEVQTTYYLRISSSVIKIYTTLADAQAQTSQVDFATTASGSLFYVYFPVYKYPPLTCWEIGAANIADIVCCPPVPSVYTDCPNQATVTYMSQTRTLKLYQTINYYGSLNTNYFVAGDFNDGFGQVFNLKAQIAFYFKYYGGNIGNQTPTAVINFHGINGTQFYNRFVINVTYSATEDFNKNIVLTLDETQFFDTYISALVAQGFLPESLTFNFSGQVTPPPQIKVYMPDAYFENKDEPINLGLVEETLTYDDATLTYWSDLLTYAGIPGRLHFAIPNFYPLTSSGVEFIHYGYYFDNYQKFPNLMFNTYVNNEFNFYETLNISRQAEYNNYYQPANNNIILFTASDFYNGYANEDYLYQPQFGISMPQAKSYPTGLNLGETWFDTRVVRNYDPTDPSVLALTPEFVIRQTSKIVIAFSKWASGKFLKSNALGSGLGESPGDLNHYHQSAYFIQSDDAGAYVSSLEV